MGKLCLFTKTTSSAMQSTPDWSDCSTSMAEITPSTPTTPPTPASTKNIYALPETKTTQLDDGGVLVQLGNFWKIVSSWHLVTPAENQLIDAYRNHHT